MDVETIGKLGTFIATLSVIVEVKGIEIASATKQGDVVAGRLSRAMACLAVRPFSALFHSFRVGSLEPVGWQRIAHRALCQGC